MTILWRRVLRWLRIAALACCALIAFLYLGFSAMMIATENHWLGSPPFHAAVDAASAVPHEFTLVDDGAASLALRLELIRSAQASLDLEFFIFELDTASRLITQALAAKARDGVRVRILVDFSLAVFKLRPAYARELARAGVEVRYYNTASVARFFSVQHRTHRKILLVDERAAMIGGRNIGDDYFDLSPHYNFLDSDVVIRGEVVGAIQESFDLYWDSPWAVSPETVTDDDAASLTGLLRPGAREREVLERLSAVDTALPVQTCPKVRFVTDYPGAGVHNRKVYGAITEALAQAKRRVLAESPYFVLRGDGLAVARALAARGVEVTVLTNSLHSTDAFYTVSPLYFALDAVADLGVDLHAYTGAAPGRDGAFPGSQRWGVHAKRAVIDDDTILIGTYNIDPRSANLNAELVVICEGSRALAAQMHADIADRLRRSEPVIDGGRRTSSNLIGDASWRSIALMAVVAPVARLFDFLL